MKVFIKDVENGWRVHYDVIGGYDEDYKKVGEKEKAFTYDFEGEKENAWRRLEWFVAVKFLDYKLHDKIYLSTYDEEYQEWVSNEEFERREDEKEKMKELKEEDEKWKKIDPRDYVGRERKEAVEWLKSWEKERKEQEKEHASKLTPETWKIECTECILEGIQKHFAKNKSMDYEKYVEIKNDAIRYFTETYGLQPKSK